MKLLTQESIIVTKFMIQIFDFVAFLIMNMPHLLKIYGPA